MQNETIRIRKGRDLDRTMPLGNGAVRGNTRRVHFEFSDARAKSVCIAATFNEWDATRTRMAPAGGGKWLREVFLPPGRYEYCFVIDGTRWATDPEASESVSNPFGGRNSVLRVGEQETAKPH